VTSPASLKKMMNRNLVASFLVPFLLSWTQLQFAGAASANCDTDEGIIGEILTSIQGWQHEHAARQATTTSSSPKLPRPFVTLTFAQSLDGKIARWRAGGAEKESSSYASSQEEREEEEPLSTALYSSSSNYPISGPGSLHMTHALRSTHQGILIGGRTLEIDNPRLTNRLWGRDLQYQPTPIVLDTHLSHVQVLGAACRVETPIVCCSAEAASSLESLPRAVRILPCRCTPDGNLDIEDVLFQLFTKCGIRTLMVEGGAAVLSCFLAQTHLFDCLCVTVAPKLLGISGMGPSFDGIPLDLTKATSSRFVLLGDDAVLLSHCSNLL
jgi:2,5-diamino-6-(ribosylamino)-4(3H)-pyrimidinone 5'-phosphate reductase